MLVENIIRIGRKRLSINKNITFELFKTSYENEEGLGERFGEIEEYNCVTGDCLEANFIDNGAYNFNVYIHSNGKYELTDDSIYFEISHDKVECALYVKHVTQLKYLELKAEWRRAKIDKILNE